MAKNDTSDITVKEFAKLNEENRRLKRQIEGYKRFYDKKNPILPEKSLPSAPSEPESAPAPSKTHFLAPWQQYCPNCDSKEAAKNPDFKDEAFCLGDDKNKGCGMHLGAMEEAKKLKRCPSCGLEGNILGRVKK